MCEFILDRVGRLVLLAVLRAEWGCSASGQGAGSTYATNFVPAAEHPAPLELLTDDASTVDYAHQAAPSMTGAWRSYQAANVCKSACERSRTAAACHPSGTLNWLNKVCDLLPDVGALLLQSSELSCTR